MGKIDINNFIEEQIKAGLSRFEAIKSLAKVFNQEIPENDLEIWLQQNIGGG